MRTDSGTIVIGGIQESSGIASEAAILPQLAPGIGALMMLLLFRKDGLRLELRGVRVRKILPAIIIPSAATVIILVLNTLILKIYEVPELSQLPRTMIFWMPFGALGEELGWRGYLQKMITSHRSPLFGAVLTGVLWAGWHVGIYRNGLVYFLFFLLLMVSYSIVLTFLCGSVFSVTIAAVFHFMINFTNLFSFSHISTEDFMIINSLVWAAIALFLLRNANRKNETSVPEEDQS